MCFLLFFNNTIPGTGRLRLRCQATATAKTMLAGLGGQRAFNISTISAEFRQHFSFPAPLLSWLELETSAPGEPPGRRAVLAAGNGCLKGESGKWSLPPLSSAGPTPAGCSVGRRKEAVSRAGLRAGSVLGAALCHAAAHGVPLSLSAALCMISRFQ